MRIEDDVKLDFDNVLFKPQRSTLSSRSEVDLNRKMKFRNCNQTFDGFPIIAANIDTAGTFEVAKVLAKHKMMTALHKHYTVEDWEKNKELFDPDFMAFSIGIRDEDHDKFLKVLSLGIDIKYLVIDVANGYSEKFIEFVSEMRKRHTEMVIVAGNVVSSDITQELILNGADIVKVGIGSGALCTTRIKAGTGVPQFSAIVECSNAAHGLGGHVISDGGIVYPGDVSKALGAGCFVGDTPIIQSNGKKKEIKNIQVGDEVYTHTFQKRKVKHKFEYDYDDELITINGITSTKNHKYYVLNKKYKNIVTKENLEKYAEWIKAEDVDKNNYLLLKLV